MNITRIEWCKMMAGSNINPFYSVLRIYVENLSGDLTKLCWITGPIGVYNMTFDKTSFLSKFPAGDFRCTLHFFDPDDSNVFKMTFYNSISH